MDTLEEGIRFNLVCSSFGRSLSALCSDALLSWEKILCPPQHTALNVIDTPSSCIIEAIMSDNHALIFTLIRHILAGPSPIVAQRTTFG